MFDVDTLIADCTSAVKEHDPRRAVREVLVRTLAEPGPVAGAMGKDVGGLDVLYNSPDLTVLNVIWAPKMSLLPHDHRMWAAIGIYGGVEDNTLYRRGPDRISPSGGREIRESEVLVLGVDAIHSVANPERRFTGAIHVYGGDFVNQPRSQWDPDTLIEQPYDIEQIRRAFAEANRAWAAQAQSGVDLDDRAG
jgi:predicted metal-dependent enzyme (double-stranded beta helix superfamily)